MKNRNSTPMSGRLQSLDTLRGFDMMFIMGVAGLVMKLCALAPGAFTDAIAAQMVHVKWDGLAHHDTIFPLFLFIAGVSFPFSLAKQRQSGVSAVGIYGKIIRRVVALAFLGLIYNGLLKLDFATLRCASVLARIGIAWGVAAVLYVNFGVRTRAVIAGAILLGYWAVSALFVAPDAPAGADCFSQEGCIAGYIDRLYLPGRLIYKNFDPEGLLSTVPAVVTAMMGMFAGEFVRLPQSRLSGTRKAAYMLVAAIVLAVAATLWNEVLPVNKKLWSSSFVCAVGAYSLGMFAIFYYIIDVRGWHRWTLFFRVIGLNSITIYLAQRIIGFQKIADFFTGGIASLCPEPVAAVVASASYVAVCWLFLYFLYRKGVFLKV